MQTVYSIVNFFNSVCLAHPNITTFTTGELTDIDQTKQTLFPLAHLVIDNITIGQNGLSTYNLNLLVMDRVANVTQDSNGRFNELLVNYKGVSSVIDVISNSTSTAADIVAYIRDNAQPYQYSITTDVVLTPFQERFSNLVAGVSAVISIQAPMINPNCLIQVSDVEAIGGTNPC